MHLHLDILFRFGRICYTLYVSLFSPPNVYNRGEIDSFCLYCSLSTVIHSFVQFVAIGEEDPVQKFAF